MAKCALTIDDRLVGNALRVSRDHFTLGSKDLTDTLKDWVVSPDEKKVSLSAGLLKAAGEAMGIDTAFHEHQRLEKQFGGSDLRHRDHVLHTMRTFLIAYEHERTIGPLCEAVMFHDIGTVAQPLDELINAVLLADYGRLHSRISGTEAAYSAEVPLLPTSPSGTYFALNRLSHTKQLNESSYTDLRRLCAAWCAAYLSTVPELLSETPRKHGFISAVLYLKSILPFVFGTNSPARLLDPRGYEYEPAALDKLREVLTIALCVHYHDLSTGSTPADMPDNFHELLRTLVCCDEAQEWGRACVQDPPQGIARAEWQIGDNSFDATFVCAGALGNGGLPSFCEKIATKLCNFARLRLSNIAISYRTVGASWRPIYKELLARTKGISKNLDGEARRGVQRVLRALRESRPRGRARSRPAIQELSFTESNGRWEVTVEEKGLL